MVERILGGLLCALLVVGCAGQAPPDGRRSPREATRPSGTPSGGPSTRPGAADDLTAADARVALPVRLRIPAIGVATTLERLRIGAHGRLRPPVDPDRAGWFPASARPGELGASVVAGHRDSVSGPAVFWRLTDLREGDPVTVLRADGSRARFTVVDVRRVSRDDFPTESVYGGTPDRTLRLVTCGGLYDHVKGRYRDNVLVLAVADQPGVLRLR